MVKFNLRLGSIEAVKDFSEKIKGVDANVDLVSGRYIVDAKSIMGVLSLSLINEVTCIIHDNNKSVSTFVNEIKEYICGVVSVD